MVTGDSPRQVNTFLSVKKKEEQKTRRISLRFLTVLSLLVKFSSYDSSNPPPSLLLPELYLAQLTKTQDIERGREGEKKKIARKKKKKVTITPKNIIL